MSAYGNPHDTFHGFDRWLSDDHETFLDKAVYFDLDGTIVDLYGIDGWLEMLMERDASPYYEAAPIVDIDAFWAYIADLSYCGWRIGVVSWLAKDCDNEFAERILQAKFDWCSEMLPTFHEIVIAQHGFPKSQAVYLPKNAILFDDEEPNRLEWEDESTNRTAYSADELSQLLLEY